MSHKLGGYWTAIETHTDGWKLRDHHETIDDAVEYAERQGMLNDGRVVILKEVVEVRYAAALEGEDENN
jgi:hypothetical protein